MHFEQLGRLDLVQAQPPAVHLAQIDLLAILVVAIGRKERVAIAVILVEITALRERGTVQQSFAVSANRVWDECARGRRCSECSRAAASAPPEIS
jgi:hypothetical protein